MSGADPALAERLAGIVSLADFEPLARAAMDPAAFDYVAGGGWDELTLADNEAAWRRRRLRPRVLVDVSAGGHRDDHARGPGRLPVALAPMAVQSLAHPDAELAMARGAAAAGVPMILSTTSSQSIETVAAAVPDGIRWFQLYVQSDMGVSRSLVERAAAVGFSAIVLTVDLPFLGYRERDRRSGFVLPPLGNFAEVPATHGSRGPVSPAELGDRQIVDPELDGPRPDPGMVVAPARAQGDPDRRGRAEGGRSRRRRDRRQQSRRPPARSRRGDRRRPAEIVDAVGGRTEVWVDGGIRRGLDIALALGLGARGVLLGRPAYWALAAAVRPASSAPWRSCARSSSSTLALLGTPTPADITPTHVAATGPTER